MKKSANAAQLRDTANAGAGLHACVTVRVEWVQRWAINPGSVGFWMRAVAFISQITGGDRIDGLWEM
jgi:hypothetical protein